MNRSGRLGFPRKIALLCALALSLPAWAALGPWSEAPLITNAAVTGPVVEWRGGTGIFTASGTFGGATVTLQFLGPDGVTLISAGAATTCTAACAGVFYLPHCFIQATVTGGAPSALYAAAARASP